ncbi:hypothetical protein [Ord River virus]|uniref:Uncharacterized protein n=1 Tax=Ord River virus TaxID=1620895 RepID=A0A0D3R2H1_9RHAB|nr:hypothetical protein [Ord River virus]AJR28600.1 hypothetical protein [Ord River virus]ASM90785.1 hypothetical protein [Ord River virus]
MATSENFDSKLAWVVESLEFHPNPRDDPVNFVLSVKIDVDFPSDMDEINLLIHIRQELKKNKMWTQRGTFMGLCAGIGLSHSMFVPSDPLRRRLMGEFNGVLNIPLVPSVGDDYIILNTTSYNLDLESWSNIKLSYTFFICRGNGKVTKRIDTSWYSGQPARKEEYTFDLLTISVLYGFDDWFVSPLVNYVEDP